MKHSYFCKSFFPFLQCLVLNKIVMLFNLICCRLFLHLFFQSQGLILKILLFLLTGLLLWFNSLSYLLLSLLLPLSLLLLLKLLCPSLLLSLLLLHHFGVFFLFLLQLSLVSLYFFEEDGSLLLSHLLTAIKFVILDFSFDHLQLVLKLLFGVEHLDHKILT